MFWQLLDCKLENISRIKSNSPMVSQESFYLFCFICRHTAYVFLAIVIHHVWVVKIQAYRGLENRNSEWRQTRGIVCTALTGAHRGMQSPTYRGFFYSVATGPCHRWGVCVQCNQMRFSLCKLSNKNQARQSSYIRRIWSTDFSL